MHYRTIHSGGKVIYYDFLLDEIKDVGLFKYLNGPTARTHINCMSSFICCNSTGHVGKKALLQFEILNTVRIQSFLSLFCLFEFVAEGLWQVEIGLKMWHHLCWSSQRPFDIE